MDLCNIQADEFFSTENAAFLHRAEVMRVKQIEAPGQTQDLVDEPASDLCIGGTTLECIIWSLISCSNI